MPTIREDLLQVNDYVDLEVQGVVIERMKVMIARRDARCNRLGKWIKLTPNVPLYIAYKHRDNLTEQQKKALYPSGTVYDAIVVLDRTPPQENLPVVVNNNDYDDNNDVVAQAREAGVTQAEKEFALSQYQAHILDRLLNGVAHLFIAALAGCGKTVTLVRLIKELMNKGLTRGKAVVYLAFNASIKDELIEKLYGTGVPAMTTHGFGFTEILKRRFKELRDAEDKAVDQWRASTIFQMVLADEKGLDYSDKSLKAVRNSDQWELRNSVCGNGGLVGFIKNWAIIPHYDKEKCYWFDEDQYKQMMDLMNQYEIEIPEDFEAEDVVRYAAATVIRGIPLPGEKLDRVDYDDMLYLPLALGLPFPKFHLVLTDETQDFNRAQELMLEKLIGDDFGRAIVVGDENQSIYGFRGADEHAFRNIHDMLSHTKKGVEVCDLPINYRSDTAIIKHAQQWVPKLQGRGAALGEKDGEVRFDTMFGQAMQAVNNDATDDPKKEQFAFLCRINLPLVVTAYWLIGMGKKVSIIGKKTIALPLLTIINELCGVVNKRTGNLPEWGTERITDTADEHGRVVEEGLLTRLATYRDVQGRKLEKEKHAKKKDELDSNCDCIELICNRVLDDSVETVRREIGELFVEDPKDKGVIMLSTVHRAKGLEWDSVYILRPDLMPHPLAESEKELIQERNLCYVAATRAKHKLHYICNWPFGNGKGAALRARGLTDEQVAQEKAAVTPDTLVAPGVTIRQMVQQNNEAFTPPGEVVPVATPSQIIKAVTNHAAMSQLALPAPKPPVYTDEQLRILNSSDEQECMAMMYAQAEGEMHPRRRVHRCERCGREATGTANGKWVCATHFAEELRPKQQPQRRVINVIPPKNQPPATPAKPQTPPQKPKFVDDGEPF
jgi:hypothetical protein